jgi:hypothetical protein
MKVQNDGIKGCRQLLQTPPPLVTVPNDSRTRSVDLDASERYANSESVARRCANVVADGALIALVTAFEVAC